MNDVTVKQALQQARQHIDTLDANVLLAHVLNCSRAHLMAWPEKVLPEYAFKSFQGLVAERQVGVPVAYLTGSKEFWSLNFKVTPDVLTPRPETELLVEEALKLLPQGGRVLDLGTGSGAIACAIAHTRPDVSVVAADVCEKALAIAKENGESLSLTNITYILSHWFENIPPQPFDLIVSNPPYLADCDPHLNTDIKHEPIGALVSGPSGLEAYEAILKGLVIAWSEATRQSTPREATHLLLEHGFDQAECIKMLLKRYGLENIRIINDLSGNPRLAYGLYKA